MAEAIPASQFSRASLVASRAFRGILAVMFVEAVLAKLIGVPPIIQVFDAIGLGQWFRFFMAAAEVGGVIALLTPGLAAFGALWLGGIMFFATLTHLFILHTSAVGAVLLFVLSLAVVWLRREQLEGLRAASATCRFGRERGAPE